MILVKYAHEVALALSIFLTGFAQVILKIGSVRYKGVIKSAINQFSILGYLIFFIVTLLNAFALQEIEFKTMAIWVTTTYVLVSCLSRFFFKEAFDSNKIIGTILIVLGIIVFNL